VRSENAPELWGGVECTINRVGEQYFEQLHRSGHSQRIDDLDRCAELGIRALRQPVIWERTAPESLDRADWNFSDRWLARLQELRIRPIVGLLHHGSGPAHTSLLDGQFPQKLATYARAVAERYPWTESYTPVNEPLTTARFSALYGLWYPHARRNETFISALLNECRATVLAMREIRKVNPAAQLVQTDDLGKVFSTPTLEYQAEFENERRWLCWDLLCGRLNRQHPMWGFLLFAGANRNQLEWFCDNPCPPGIIGVNHYLSSERFLDENVALYPSEPRGTNTLHVYTDVLAARARPEGAAGPKQILREAWDRYHIPVAVTEAHNGCTREEQLRWLLEIWQGACELRSEGADIRAVTLWSLLGAYDWNSLVTCKNDHYEPGVFDIRSPQPRPTAIAKLAKELGEGKRSEHPLLQVPGWWKRPERMIYHPRQERSGTTFDGVRPVLITGGRGTLGRAFERACVIRGIPYRLLLRSDVDIADGNSVSAALERYEPWAVINTAGYVRVDDAQTDCDRCFRENSEGAAIVAAACAGTGTQLVTFSSDLVFDGLKAAPYVESDRTNGLNVYGQSKAEAESRILELLPSALVVRTSAFFGPWDEHNFVTLALRTLASGQRFRAAADCLVSPTYVPDLVDTTLDLFIDGEHGIWHLANQGSISWADLALRAARAAGMSESLIEPVTLEELALPAPRPSYSVLGSEKAWIMPKLEDAISRYVGAAKMQWEPAQEPTASAD
jgi:dTDP-4-dehydrorhamnose reductase